MQRLVDWLLVFQIQLLQFGDRVGPSSTVDAVPKQQEVAAARQYPADSHQRIQTERRITQIVKATPKEKRLSYVDHINQDTEIWKDDDGRQDYSGGILYELSESVFECAAAGADLGGRVGSTFGRTGETIGRVVGSVAGGVVGGMIGAAKAIFKW